MAEKKEAETKPGEITDEKLFDAMYQVTENATPEIKKGIETFFDGVIRKGIPPKDALGLKDEMMEGLYGQAYHLFNNGRYNDAAMIFRLLVMLDTMEPKYTMGLGACLHMTKEYLMAAQVYAMAAILDIDNPLPYYHASDCWIRLGNLNGALDTLKQAVTRAGSNPEYKMLHDRCLMTIQSIKEGGLSQGAAQEQERPKI